MPAKLGCQCTAPFRVLVVFFRGSQELVADGSGQSVVEGQGQRAAPIRDHLRDPPSEEDNHGLLRQSDLQNHTGEVVGEIAHREEVPRREYVGEFCMVDVAGEMDPPRKGMRGGVIRGRSQDSEFRIQNLGDPPNP